MEDVLDLYAEPYDPQYPVVCFDESPYQLVSEVRQPLPVAPGHPARYDYEYRWEGTCNLFMCFEPLQGWRHIKVTDRRTTHDFVHCIGDLVDLHFPKVAVISVVLDNLNTHTPGASRRPRRDANSSTSTPYDQCGEPVDHAATLASRLSQPTVGCEARLSGQIWSSSILIARCLLRLHWARWRSQS
jgi:hypothetical protein